ncbi:MAG: IS1380 family transposase [Betaproteobacteria bacterium]
MAWALHGVLLDLFVESFAHPRRSWCWTSTPATCRCTERRRGGSSTVTQPAPAKAGDHYCYLPLYVFCGERLLACVLRPSNRDGAYQAAAVLKRLVKRLRQAWPGVCIVLRGDSGFCRRRLMNWCERNAVSYVIGLARNARLHERVALVERALEEEYRASGVKQRGIGEFVYAAGSWKSQRRVVTRLEYGAEGTNPRFVVTNLEEPAAAIYDERYCARGEAENRIKEVQLGLFGTRASGHKMASNQLRLLFSAMACTLIERLRALALAGTALARAQAATIRVRLLKIGATIVCNTRRVRIFLPAHHPARDTFLAAARALAP